MLGVFRGEMAIFLLGILCILELCGSESVMVLGGISWEFCVRTRPEGAKQEINKNYIT